jgi:quercetin dioxygenase-like cupin family protein
MHRTPVVLSFLLLATPMLGQTKAPAKKSGPSATMMATVVPLGAEKWGDIPEAAMVGTPSVEIGGKLQIAIVQGSPMQAGQPYTLRLSCTDGAKIAPHWHPTTENVTVVKGTFALGMGSKWDPSALKDLPAGGFASAPARMRHFASCKGDTIVQVHGLGPFIVNFVPAGKSASGN